MTSTISDHRVTHEADEASVAPIREVLHEAGQEGLPLMDVLHKLAERGYPLPSLSKTMTQLIREGRVDLTTDRLLRWIEAQ
jgi:hypothetical protein